MALVQDCLKQLTPLEHARQIESLQIAKTNMSVGQQAIITTTTLTPSKHLPFHQ
jgi:hypothetical protein